ncbi:MAG TPA: hypothetical protein VEL76_03230 [Gemmataceae bacterium]|nr:hypothetical protein [Gemmataceae bacterium]
MYPTSTPPPAPPGFRGWFKPQGERTWRALCEGQDYDACWQTFLRRLPRQSGDGIVLEGHRTPADGSTKAGPRPWEKQRCA